MTSAELRKALQGLHSAWDDYLFSLVGKKLTGRGVKIQIDTPPLPGSRGLTVRDGDSLLIYIRPGLDDDQLFQTYCHECAHGLLHYDGLADVSQLDRVLEVREKKSGSAPAPAWLMEKRRRAHDQREAEAAQQAREWYDYAAHHGDKLQDRLHALLEWHQKPTGSP